MQAGTASPDVLWVRKQKSLSLSQVSGSSLPFLPCGDEWVSEKSFLQLLTPAVRMETNAGLGQVIDVVPSRTRLDVYRGIPEAAVAIEAGAGLARDDAVRLSRVAAVEPDGSMGPAVVLGDAEGRHGIASHASEAIPLAVDLTVARGLAVGAIYLMICVPPGLVQADVGRAGVQG